MLGFLSFSCGGASKKDDGGDGQPLSSQENLKFGDDGDMELAKDYTEEFLPTGASDESTGEALESVTFTFKNVLDQTIYLNFDETSTDYLGVFAAANNNYPPEVFFLHSPACVALCGGCDLGECMTEPKDNRLYCVGPGQEIQVEWNGLGYYRRTCSDEGGERCFLPLRMHVGSYIFHLAYYKGFNCLAENCFCGTNNIMENALPADGGPTMQYVGPFMEKTTERTIEFKY